MKRQYRIQQLSSKSAGSGMIDVPHMAMLRYLDARSIKSWFKERWGSEPTGVVLPVTHPDGLLFRVDGLDEPLSPYANVSNTLRDFQDIVRVFAEQGLEIYLLINPTLEFVRAAPLHLVDIVGQGSHAVCIGNSVSRGIAAAILGTGIDIAYEATKNTPGKLAGIVIDAVNLFPVGAKDERIKLTCFCPSCQEWFEANAPGLLRHFRTFPNPWNLVLKDNGAGIGYIDDIRLTSQAEDVIGLARQRGYDEIYGSNVQRAFLLEQAHLLLQYVRVRHDQTIAAIDDIYTEATRGLEAVIKRVLIVEGSYYGWTSGLQLEDLDRLPTSSDSLVPYTEIWFDPASTDLFLTSVPFRSYMVRRSRYYIDEFLRTIDSFSDPVKRATTGAARLSRPAAQALLRQRLNLCMGVALTGSSTLISLPPLKSLETESQRVGFVGVALTQEIGERFIQGISIPDGITSQQGEGGLTELLERLSAARSEPESRRKGQSDED